MSAGVDDLDARIISLFTSDPGVGVLGASRRLGVARGTIQARLERLRERGVITSFAPHVSPAGAGFPVTAYCSLQIRQVAGQSPVAEHLAAIPEVLEAATITGAFDLLVVVVARDNADLQRVIDTVVDHPLVERASTQIVLATHIAHRTLPLVRAAAGLDPAPDPAPEPAPGQAPDPAHSAAHPPARDPGDADGAGTDEPEPRRR